MRIEDDEPDYNLPPRQPSPSILERCDLPQSAYQCDPMDIFIASNNSKIKKKDEVKGQRKEEKEVLEVEEDGVLIIVKEEIKTENVKIKIQVYELEDDGEALEFVKREIKMEDGGDEDNCEIVEEIPLKSATPPPTRLLPPPPPPPIISMDLSSSSEEDLEVCATICGKEVRKAKRKERSRNRMMNRNEELFASRRAHSSVETSTTENNIPSFEAVHISQNEDSRQRAERKRNPAFNVPEINTYFASSTSTSAASESVPVFVSYEQTPAPPPTKTRFGQSDTNRINGEESNRSSFDLPTPRERSQTKTNGITREDARASSSRSQASNSNELPRKCKNAKSARDEFTSKKPQDLIAFITKACALCVKNGASNSKARFETRGQAVSHQKQEHNRKPCPVCFRLLSFVGFEWKKHILDHHVIGQDKSVEVVKCPFCPRVFKFDGLYYHISKQHLLPIENGTGERKDEDEEEKESEEGMEQEETPSLHTTTVSATQKTQNFPQSQTTRSTFQTQRTTQGQIAPNFIPWKSQSTAQRKNEANESETNKRQTANQRITNILSQRDGHIPWPSSTGQSQRQETPTTSRFTRTANSPGKFNIPMRTTSSNNSNNSRIPPYQRPPGAGLSRPTGNTTVPIRPEEDPKHAPSLNEITRLCLYFVQNPKPDQKEFENIASALKLHIAVVKKWFYGKKLEDSHHSLTKKPRWN